MGSAIPVTTTAVHIAVVINASTFLRPSEEVQSDTLCRWNAATVVVSIQEQHRCIELSKLSSNSGIHVW